MDSALDWGFLPIEGEKNRRLGELTADLVVPHNPLSPYPIETQTLTCGESLVRALHFSQRWK
jgi:hypothetical protein